MNSIYSETAVVINDDDNQRSLLSSLLKKAGLEPVSFSCAESALAAMKSSPAPTLIVTGLAMPGLDGWRFCRLLRSPEYIRLNQVPLVVISDILSDSDAEQVSHDVGADLFIGHPFDESADESAFINQIHTLIKGKRFHYHSRALIVDDSRVICQMLKKAFSEKGYLTDTAMTVNEACLLFNSSQYDVAILDFHLPDGTGENLLVSFHEIRPECVFLMMTTESVPELALAWMKKGASAYLRKPFQPDYLIDLCARVRRERSLLRIQDTLDIRSRELWESRQKFHSIFDSMIEGVALHKVLYNSKGIPVDYVIEKVNKSFETITGLPAKTAEGSKASELYGTNNPPYLDIYSRIAETRQPERFETTFDPMEKNFSVSVSSSARGYFTTIFEDITARKKADDLLRKTQEKYRLLVERTNAGVFITTLPGSFLQINKAMVKMAGYDTAEELMTKPATCLYANSNDREKLKDLLIQNGEVRDYEIHAVKKDGTTHWVSLNAVLLKHHDGEDDSILGILNDITERKLADEALRESEYFFKESQRVASIGSYKTDFRKGVWESSEVLDQIFGVGKDFVHSVKGWFDIVHPDDRDTIFAYLREEAFKKKHFVNKEFRIIRKSDGKVRWVSGYGDVEFDESGHLKTMIGTIQDITDRKKAEEDKLRLEIQLQQAQKIESVGRLAGGVAHDFNNMLGVILGHTEMALEQVDPMDTIHDNLLEIRKAAERSANLTRQLLAYARKQTVLPKVIDLNDTISGMLKMLQRLIGEHITLIWQPGRDIWDIKMDPSQIDQILANLCINARDAIKTRGIISIETENLVIEGTSTEKIHDCQPGKYVRLVVSDNGTGMDKDTADQIFEPFFTTKGIGEGTGLGLATVYGAIKQNKGFITVSSEPGTGTEFKLYIPRHITDSNQLHLSIPEKPVLSGDETILLVEDEVAILSMTEKMLQHHGYHVLSASSPHDAIRAANTFKGVLHLLVTDVIMPGMNGRELSEHLKHNHPELKSLFMSGYTGDIIADNGVIDDGVSFIQKPFTMKDLSKKIRDILDKPD